MNRTAGIRAVETRRVDPADPVFSGHYPGFPVLPGVYLIEFADQTARRAHPDPSRVRLVAIERCRFLRPVFPGDNLTIDVSFTGTPPGRAAARLHTSGGRAADIVLSYRVGEAA